jgi:uncharacterized protein YcgL (UPF0745 family)
MQLGVDCYLHLGQATPSKKASDAAKEKCGLLRAQHKTLPFLYVHFDEHYEILSEPATTKHTWGHPQLRMMNQILKVQKLQKFRPSPQEVTPVLENGFSLLKRDFLSNLKIFPKTLATAPKGEERSSKLEEKILERANPVFQNWRDVGAITFCWTDKPMQESDVPESVITAEVMLEEDLKHYNRTFFPKTSVL